MAIADDLASAKLALHQLLTGKSVAQFRDSNGEFVSYGKTDIASLRAYITELQAAIDAAAGVRRPGGPMRIFF